MPIGIDTHWPGNSAVKQNDGEMGRLGDEAPDHPVPQSPCLPVFLFPVSPSIRLPNPVFGIGQLWLTMPLYAHTRNNFMPAGKSGAGFNDIAARLRRAVDCIGHRMGLMHNMKY